jgi:DNA mismatch repair protein MSH5
MGSKSMTTEQSTFMIDLHQVGTMLRYRGSDPEAYDLIFQL